MQTELEKIAERLNKIENALSIQESNTLVDIDWVRKETGLAKNTIYKYIKEKSIPVYRFGRLLRFKRVEVQQWMQSRIEEASENAKTNV